MRVRAMGSPILDLRVGRAPPRLDTRPHARHNFVRGTVIIAGHAILQRLITALSARQNAAPLSHNSVQITIKINAAKRKKCAHEELAFAHKRMLNDITQPDIDRQTNAQNNSSN